MRDLLLEAQASGIALLWDQRGLTLHWPQARSGPDEVARCSDLGVRLACWLSGRERGLPEARAVAEGPAA